MHNAFFTALYCKIQRWMSTCEDLYVLFTKLTHFHTVPWNKVCNRRQHSTIIMLHCVSLTSHILTNICTHV